MQSGILVWSDLQMFISEISEVVKHSGHIVQRSGLATNCKVFSEDLFHVHVYWHSYTQARKRSLDT